jgi:DNA-binding CsgD family transcriptional regulator
LHEWWIAKLRRELIDDAEVTEGELKLLQWEWQGLNSKQIGNLLGMGPAGVDSRFQRLNLKLGVPNRRAAAKLAAEYGLI